MKNATQSSGMPTQRTQDPPDDDQADDQAAAPGGDQGEPPRRTKADQLTEISKLLREPSDDQDDDQGDDQDDAQGDGKTPRQVRSIAQAAKALGVPIESLYDLEIPLRVASGEKKSIKLSELKNYHDAQNDHAVERLSWEEQRGRETAELARSRSELAELLAMVPADKLDKTVLDRVRARHDGIIKLEKQKTLQRIPAWQDDDRREAELEGIAEHLADYGFPANALQGISDHRMLAYMRDNWLRFQRLNAALEKVKPVRSGAPPRGKAAGKPPGKEPVRTSAGARTIDRQVDAVSKLLRG